MNAKQQHQLQQIVIDYFKDTDNTTIALLVDTFVYNLPSSKETQTLLEKFLKDNGVMDAYLNTLIDLQKGSDAIFLRASLSERDMIDVLRNGFLNLVFNRFRDLPLASKVERSADIERLAEQILDKAEAQKAKKPQPHKVKVLGTSEIEKSVHVVCNINQNYTLCSLLIDGDMIGDTEDKPEEAVDCEHCKRIVKMCQSISL